MAIYNTQPDIPVAALCWGGGLLIGAFGVFIFAANLFGLFFFLQPPTGVLSTTVALATPNELRGRVNAGEMVFISASNELGALESGLVASVTNAMFAVVFWQLDI